MVLFVVLWRQAEKKAEHNFKSYDDLRQRIINLAHGKKSVSTKDLTDTIHDVQYGTQEAHSQPTAIETSDEYVEYVDDPQPEQQVAPRQPYIDPVVDSYNEQPAEPQEAEQPAHQQATAETTSAKPEILEIREIEQPLSPKEIEANKERATLRNLNIMLYMASFLLVAAAAAFVAAAMPVGVRLAGLLAVVVLFYIAGIVLYKRAPRFKPAAIAFVGTGLAILPFVGVALTLLGGISASSAWLITSVAGVVAYVYAGTVLQSQVVSYLSMAFVLSAVSSAVSVASLPTVWYFISLIGVSLVASTISYFRPHMLPDVFKKPVETTGQIVTPTALVASIFAAQSMTIQMYEILFVVSTAHYAVVLMQRRTLFYETVVRMLAHLSLLIVAWDAANYDSTVFGMWWIVLVITQVAYSLVSLGRTHDAKRLAAERVWLAVSHSALVVSLAFWASNSAQQLYITINLVLLGGVALASALVTRQAGWGYVSLATSLIAPFTLGRGFAEPQWPYMVLILTFTVLGAAALTAYWKLRGKRSTSVLRLFAVSVVMYVVAILLCGALDGNAVTHGSSMVFAGLLVVGFSYAVRLVPVELVGATLLTYGFGVIASTFATGQSWKLYAGAVVMASLFALGAVAHQYVDKSEPRRDGLVALALITFAIFAFIAPRLDELVHILTLLLTLAVLLSLIGLRWLAGRDKQSTIRTILTIGYIGYLAIGWYSSIELSAGWTAIYYVVATAVLWLASRLERKPWVLLLGNGAALLACLFVWRWLAFDPEWEALCVGIVAAGIFYLMYAFYITYKDVERQWIMSMSSWAVLVGAMFFGYGDTLGHQVVSVLALLCSVAILLTHRYVGNRSKKDSERLTTAISSASGVYLLLAISYVLRDAQLAAWTFMIAGVVTVWLSYRLNNRWIEVFGAVQIIAAIGFWISLTNLGDWRLTVAVALSTALLAVGATVHSNRSEPERRNGLLAAALVVVASMAFNYHLQESGIAQLSYVVLIVVAVISMAIRWLLQRRIADQEVRHITASTYATTVLLAWLMSYAIGLEWTMAASLVAGIIFWLSSHVERLPGVIMIGQLFIFAAALQVWELLELSSEWRLFAAVWLSTVIYYIGYLIYVKLGDSWRAVASLIASLVALVVVPLLSGMYISGNEPQLIAAYASLVVAAVMVIVHGLLFRLHNLVEMAVYVGVFGLQRIVSIIVPGIDTVWYAHWWAVTIAAMALWRPSNKTIRFGIAMGLITTTVGLLALAEGGIYQLLFLVEHILLLVAGALLRKQWAVWWGIGASVIAILYFIKDYTYLWLGLMGLALIALVVWRLNKLSKSQKK